MILNIHIQKHNKSTSNLYILFGFLIYMCIGSIYSWSVFRKPLEEQLKISATQSGLPYMTFLLIFSFTMPFAGSLIEKLKPVKTILLGNLLLLCGFLISSFSKGILQLTIAYGLIVGFGVGIIYGVPIAVISKWSLEKRGLAMGLTLAGFGASPFITAPLIKYLISTYELFVAFRILGILFFLIILALSLPMRFPNYSEEAVKSTNNIINDINISPKIMLKTKEFYSLWICFMFGTLVGLTIIGITSPFAQEVVKINNKSELFISLFAVFNGIGRPIFGFLTDKLKPFKSILLSYIVIIISSVFGLLLNPGRVLLFAIIFSLLWLTLGGWLAIAPSATVIIFGSKHYTQNYGFVYTAYGIGAILGVLLSGKIRDLWGSYFYIFYPLIIVSTLGIIISSTFLKNSAYITKQVEAHSHSYLENLEKVKILEEKNF